MRLYAPIAGFVQEISINTIVCKFYFSFDWWQIFYYFFLIDGCCLCRAVLIVC
jgi:hypothetical protein